MAETYDLILKGGTVVNHDGEGARDLGIRGGRFAAIGDLARASAGEVIDCRGLHLLPGVIDTQVHFREPGLTHKEDLETGSRGAVLGGVTAVFEMPNTNPPTTSAEALGRQGQARHHRMHCDFAFYVGATRENTKDLGELEMLPGCAGVKVFMGSSTGSLLIEDDDGVRAVLKAIRRRAAFHSEDEYRLRERMNLRVEGDPRSHPVWRDATAALMCTQRLIGLARETGKRVHVLHVTTAQEMALPRRPQGRRHGRGDAASSHAGGAGMLRAARHAGPAQSADPRRRPPRRPLARHRARRHRQHRLRPFPAHPRGKGAALSGSPSGMTGVQTLVPIMLDHVNAGRLSLLRLVDLTSAGPARLFGIAGKGRIAAGYDADLTVVDLKRRETITDRWIASRAGWTPYNGVTVTGWPVGTLVRGHKVMWEGSLTAGSQGERVRFLETLAS